MPYLGCNLGLPWNRGIGAAWSPGLLPALQWLTSIVGTEAIDQTSNELDANITSVNYLQFTAISNSYIQTAVDSEWMGATGIFDISFSAKRNTDSTTERVFYGVSSSLFIQFLSSGRVQVAIYDGAGSLYCDSISGNQSGTTDWTDYRIVGDGSKVIIYINGSSIKETTYNATYPNGTGRSSVMKIGYSDSSFHGELSNFAISDGTSEVIHYPLAEGLGATANDISGNGSDGTINNAAWATSDGILSANLINGCSKTLNVSGATTIAVTGLVGTETITSTGTGSVAASAGTLTLTVGYVSTISIDGTLTYELKDGYGATLPSVNGTWPDGVLTDGGWMYFPALADGTDDVEGLGLTNPSGYVHNNFEGSIQQKAANTEFLDNSFWSAGGATYDKKSFNDLINHIDLDEQVTAVDDGEFITQVITLAQSLDLTPSQYISFISWLAGQGETGTHLIPYEVTGGGIGPDGTWYTADGIYIYLVEDA